MVQTATEETSRAFRSRSGEKGEVRAVVAASEVRTFFVTDDQLRKAPAEG